MDSLDPEQQAAVLAPRGPVCVLAGAGTGKTRTITRRIAHLVGDGHVRGSQVLAVTFTARAAGEMRTRLRSLGIAGSGNAVQALTFHAAAMRQLRYFWPQAIGDNQWELLDNKFPVVSRAARSAGAPTTTDSLRDLISEIEWAKGSLIGPDQYAVEVSKSRREAPMPAEQVALVYERYEQLKVSPSGDQLLDFDDLLLMTRAILDDHPVVAEEFRDRYRCFVVDEYQDVTPAQQALLNAWLGERDDLTVVGDANQTIYSFTGATPSYLLDFSRRFPEAMVVRLERDYRSTPQVVGLANRVIGAARGRIAGTRLQLIGQRPPGPAPDFAEYDDEPAEAAAVAKAIKRLMAQGVPGSEIAILYRINAQSEAHEQALTAAGIPYQVRGGEAFFARSEIRQAMRAVQQTAGRDDLPAEADVVTLLRAILVPLGLSDDPPAGAQARERWESLRALLNLTEEMVHENEHLTLTELSRELAARAEARHPPTVQGVTLSSLHAAKGLEWDAVFLVGMVDGSVPISQAINAGDVAIEEERRLLYVGITRAREHLQLSWALARNEGGRRSRRRSRFLADLVPDDSPASRIAEPKRKRSGPRCRVCGKALLGKTASLLGRCESCPSDLDEGLLVALKEWRSGRAKEQKVPAYVVFSDNTLIAIAEQQPGDVPALVAIPGIGAKKLDQYGEDLLALVRDNGGG
ncbi:MULTISPECIES: ATP-dependent DNA helicase UvrD2 [Actinomycetes]|uniref:ATP-dependent DNA helicase UvrD2 n=1 Tax=Williamsia marianensis TaxID=85044 RepID=A0A315SEH0_WILMA|nr:MULTISPECIES: ATP-dependent DNA helicase UvrD2 [Actinomycetes]MCK0519635.1 ATP-dependent DNA helicase UvrD2 [Williamsia sp. DF01-3]PVY34289.1 Rep family ATP-dependent DNA helicase [Williamsia marianensis]RKR94579.1 Rep family ATP-dependent DNA helicase [Williamsia muralis]